MTRAWALCYPHDGMADAPAPLASHRDLQVYSNAITGSLPSWLSVLSRLE